VAISVNIVVLQIAYGNPGSLGEPLGLWSGRATVTGDATGGGIQVRFEPQNPTLTPTLDDQRLQYVWFLDAAGVIADVSSGNHSIRLQTHWARPNSALTNPLDLISIHDSRTDGQNFGPLRDPMVPTAWQRIPIFWDAQELASGNQALTTLVTQNNIDAGNYTFSAYGRYYDRQILGNRSFGRLISPVAISQFEG